MNKYLKLFETEQAFIDCLDAKINGDNNDMGFPNVSVIGTEDSNGNFSASKVYYIKNLAKANAIFLDLATTGNWVNPTNGTIIEDHFNIKKLQFNFGGYGPSGAALRFQPYDWYDKKTKTTYYAFISYDAYKNIMSIHYGDTVDFLDGNQVGRNFLEGYNGYDPNSFFSDFNRYDNPPQFSGRILYVKDLSEENPKLYIREFTLNGTELIFEDIKPIDGEPYVYFDTEYVSNGIEGYTNLGSGSGSGSGSGDYSY